MKFACFPVLTLGLDGDGVAMLQHQGGLSRDVALQKNAAPSESFGGLLQDGTGNLVVEKLGQLSAAVDAAQAGEEPISVEALMDLFKSLSGEIESFLVQESDDDQDTFNDDLAKHNRCISHYDTRTSATGDVTLNKKVLDAAQAKHASCRKSEKTWKDLKSAHECVLAGMGSDALHTLPQCPDTCGLQQRSESDSKSYRDLQPSGIRSKCSEEQILYEDRFCDYRVAKLGMCTGLRECVQLVDLDSMKTKMAKHADHRRTVWSEVEWIGCRIENLANLRTDNQTECTKRVNVTKYVLTLDVPTPPECQADSVSVFPDDEDCQAWRQQEYNWQADEYIIPSKCEAVCQVVDSVEVADGCTDASDVCDFYNHHADACGSYNNPAFNATEACCICGKEGTTTTTTTTTTLFDGIAHYSMRVTGNKLADFSGRAEATLNGQWGTTEGVCGKAAAMAHGSWAQLPSSACVSGNNPRTIAFWMRSSGHSSIYPFAFGRGPNTCHSPPKAPRTYFVSNIYNGYVQFHGCHYDHYNYSAAKVDDGEWHHIVYTYDGSYLSTYVDGKENWKVHKPGLVSDCSFRAIGVDNHFMAYFPGDMDDFRIYARVLSPDNISALVELKQAGCNDPAA